MTAFDLLAERATEALERIAAALEAFAEAVEPEPGDERTGEDEPEPPIDAAPEWQPVKGGRAFVPGFGLVVVDRMYESEGEVVAVCVREDGVQSIVRVIHLAPVGEGEA